MRFVRPVTISRTALCILYALVALVALVGTWANNLQLEAAGPLDANVRFWAQSLATPVSRSLTVDLLLLAASVTTWMVLEARRVGLRFVWLWVIAGVLVGVSVIVPLFLIVRERALGRTAGPVAGTLRPVDLLGLAVVGATALAYTFVALR